MRNLTRIYAAVFALLFLGFAQAVFSAEAIDIGAGARSIGMGRAYNAVTADGYSLFANPAGIAGLNSIQVVSMYGELSGDVSYTQLGAEFPTQYGVFGIGYAGSKAGEIVVSTVDATGRIVPFTTFNYGNDLYLFSYGNKYKDRLDYGITLKSFRKGSSQIQGGEGTGMNADAGLTYQVDKRFRLGLSLRNIMMGTLGAIKWGNGYVEQLPIELKLGLALQPREDILCLFDVNSKSEYPSDAKAGIEWNINKNFSLRAGAEQLAASDYSRYINYSAGVGVNYGSIKFDYAYYYDTILSYNSRHFISFAVTDIGKRQEAAKSALREKKPAALAVAKKITIPDVPDPHWASNAVQYVVSRKYLSLYPDGLFRPDKDVIRADLATVVLKVKYGAVPKDALEMSFTDVPKTYWARTAIGKAAGLDLLKGYPDGTFKPSGKVSLLDAILVCVKLGGLSPSGKDLAAYSNISPNHFAAAQIKAAKDAGLLDYVTSASLPTERPLTRAQLAWMLYKLKN
ncbi:MAG: S-layer homology domain-containing protein [Candidatus Margulisiibacteriota bacterium]